MSSIKRLFQTGAQNPVSGTSGSPSGVVNGFTAPAVPVGSAGVATFPALNPGQGILLKNNGPNTLRLWFTDGQSAPTLTRAQIMAEGTGTLLIPSGKFVILETIQAGCGVAYTNGPWSAVPGSFSYSIELSPPDAPTAATVL
jgi:hypothetical protein